MNQTAQIINRVLPIIFLLFLGYQLRRRQWISENTIDELRSIVVNFALPSVLFLAFVQIELKPAYLLIFVIVFILMLIMFGLGNWVGRRLRMRHIYFPFLMAGFEYGMLGVSLFGSAYGLEKIGYIAVIDLGHEIFIWFVFLAFLLMRRDGHQSGGQLLRSFFRSPVIVAILLGLALNLMGVVDILFDFPVAGGLFLTFQFLGDLTVPAMLLIIGYSLRMDSFGVREALPVIMMRLAIIVPVALVLGNFFIDKLLMLESAFRTALFTLFILPPPFIIPLYIRSEEIDERGYVNNTLALHTVISVLVFIVFFILNPTL
ncbi:MAG TPA: AEC family transporter [Anaerolineales bacterium]|nr:AEC family transporter [Anaerolineales bacterium]